MNSDQIIPVNCKIFVKTNIYVNILVLLRLFNIIDKKIYEKQTFNRTK